MKQTQKVQGELIFGIHPVVEAIKAKKRKLLTLYTTRPEPKGWQQILDVLGEKKVPIQYVERTVLTRMAETTDHQGVIGWVTPFIFKKQMFDSAKHPVLLMLDGIQDPRNVGAMLRSAYCTGIDGVIMLKKGSAPLTATALKASAGLAEHLDIFLVGSAQEAIVCLKKAGYTVYLATFNGTNAMQVSFVAPLCLVIGSEGVGVSRAILKEGTAITLPQRTKEISYNASVAAGILSFLVATKVGKLTV
jgi:23S rRNA (guanosine2251-2'-O)-methyltransferase